MTFSSGRMNAVMGLCLFCESHGPRLVLVTQPYRGLPPLDGAAAAADPVPVPLASPGGSRKPRRLFYGDYQVPLVVE